MARKISSGNIAYKLRRGQPDLLCEPGIKTSKFLEDTLLTTYTEDYKKPKLPSPPSRGKRQELLERYLFEKISADIAKQQFAPREAPSYITTAQDHFGIPGFDPDAGLQPSFQYSLYTDPVLTYWSENRRIEHGVTVPDNPSKNFNSSRKFSKCVAERFDGGEDW